MATKVRARFYAPGRLGPDGPLVGRDGLGRGRLGRLLPRRFADGAFLVDPATLKRIGPRYGELLQLGSTVVGRTGELWSVVDPATGDKLGLAFDEFDAHELLGERALIARGGDGWRVIEIAPIAGAPIRVALLRCDPSKWNDHSFGVAPRIACVSARGLGPRFLHGL